jgi:apolipoprotein N-acyltransferase
MGVSASSLKFSSLKWFGSSFHVLAAKYLKVLIPYLVVLVDGILAVFWYLKEYLLCLIELLFRLLILIYLLSA